MEWTEKYSGKMSFEMDLRTGEIGFFDVEFAVDREDKQPELPGEK